MGENFTEQRGLHLPRPIEQLRRAGSAALGAVFNNGAYYERMRDSQAEQRDYEDKLISDLRERVSNLDEQEEIAEAQRKHPSNKGYL